MPFNKILLFGTSMGIEQLLYAVPHERIVGIVAPSIRPLEVEKIQTIVGKLSLNIPLLIQPSFNSSLYEAFRNNIAALQIDSIVSNAYSMIIRPCILKMCDYNAINIHWSLLPYNRGPNPVQWALIKGESKTGVSIHYIDDGLDTGDIIATSEVTIQDDDTWVTLSEKLYLTSELLIKLTMQELFNGTMKRKPQNHEIASQNIRLTTEYPKIVFSQMSDKEIFNLIRAQVKPLRGAYIENEAGNIHFTNYMDYESVKMLRKAYAE